MRTRRTVFILISGKAGVGKSTLANYLASKLGDNTKGISVMVTAFANPIKQLALHYFGWDRKKDAKGRKLLQVIGTECGREYNENIWVEKTLENVFTMNLYPPNFVIIDDWRFPNECTYIEDLGVHDVYTIRIEAPDRESLKGTPEANHFSETSLSKGCIYDESDSRWFADNYYYVVDNNKDFNNLYRQGDEIVNTLKKLFILE